MSTRGRRAAQATAPASRRARLVGPGAAGKTRPTKQDRAARRAATTPRGMLRQLLSISAMAGVAALIVSTSLPASAFYGEDGASVAESSSAVSAAVSDVQTQKVTVNAKAATAAAESAPIARDSYEAKSFAQQITNLRGNPNFTYTNNPNGTIQWPFPSTVPISSGFGPRAVCSYCSSYHLGVDFTPGSGVPIQSITAGTVSAVTISGGGLGNNVTVDHVVNGQRVQSVYAHMQWGSIQVAVGQQIAVGTVIGAVGNTGNSTGAHLHLEIHVEGTPIDPYAWLKANAN